MKGQQGFPPTGDSTFNPISGKLFGYTESPDTSPTGSPDTLIQKVLYLLNRETDRPRGRNTDGTTTSPTNPSRELQVSGPRQWSPNQGDRPKGPKGTGGTELPSGTVHNTRKPRQPTGC